MQKRLHIPSTRTRWTLAICMSLAGILNMIIPTERGDAAFTGMCGSEENGRNSGTWIPWLSPLSTLGNLADAWLED